MRLVRVFGVFAVTAIFSIGMACKKAVPVVKPVQRVEAPICTPIEVVADVATVVQPQIEQEVIVPVKVESTVEVEANDNIKLADKISVGDPGTCSESSGTVGIIIEDINFDLDSYLIREVDKAKLQSIAELLIANPKMKIQITGNCDERGTAEYNLILGERRAHAAYNYLLGFGLTGSRLSTISYGKEKPKADGHDKESWFINRNCQFFATVED